jgi:phosphoglycolate phosphatase
MAIPIDLVCLDMAGTTVVDDGLVEEAFATAMASEGIDSSSPTFPPALAHVRTTMGQSKISVFSTIFGGDAQVAERANRAFEQAYGALVGAGRIGAIAGAEEAIAAVVEQGMKVCFTTGFSPPTREAIITALGWDGLVDLALSPADCGRGRPYPDMILTAVLRLGIDDVAAVAVAGDTTSDLIAGTRAGAAIVAGVLTGAHDRATLETAPHTHLIDSVADLPPLLMQASAG